MCFDKENCPDGCPVEELAGDPRLTDQITDYRRGKALFNRTEDPKVMEGVCTRLGLYEDPQTHLEMETIYAQWQQKTRN